MWEARRQRGGVLGHEPRVDLLLEHVLMRDELNGGLLHLRVRLHGDFTIAVEAADPDLISRLH